MLQSLRLIPAQQTMSLRSLIQPTLICALPLPNASLELLTSPFLLLWAYGSSNSYLNSVLWYFIRNATPKPSKPDRISRLALEPVEDAEDKVPGFRDPPWTVANEVNFQTSKIKDFFQSYLKPLFVRPTPIDRLSTPNHPEPTTSAHLPPAHLPTPSPDRSSTATPDPEDLFVPSGSPHNSSPRIWFDPEAEPEEPRPQPLSRTNTLFTPLNQSPATTPPASPRVRASLIHHDSETVTMQLELVESFHRIDVEDDLELRDPPIDAPEAAQVPQNPPAADVSTAVEEIAEANVDPSEPTISTISPTIHESSQPGPRSASAISSPRPHRHHRHRHHHHHRQHHVTALSNFSTDALASHAACWLTTAALLPFEALFVRSLAHAFLRHSVQQQPQQQLLLRPLFGFFSSSSSGGRGGGGWKAYYGTMLALMGVQALVSSVVWGVGTAAAVGMGRGWYRWGVL